MRAIIIDDKDAHALLDRLHLTALREAGHFRGRTEETITVEDMHRVFNFVVVRWLQEQGASVVR